MNITLSIMDMQSLCAVARETIEAKLSHRKPLLPALGNGCLQKGGAFVTLHERGYLRGCVGRMYSEKTLGETIGEMAFSAAFEDPRFEPLCLSEIAEIEIEITVLGPLHAIVGEKDVVVGKHGLYISAQGRSGVLLPQVATENGWDASEFLCHLCLKAGVPTSAWKAPGSQLFVFEGLVFGEEG